MEYKYLSQISSFLRSADQESVADFADSISRTQYQSKKWLIDTLKGLRLSIPDNPSVLILGGWYGSFLVPMLKQFNPSVIYLNDKDPAVLRRAQVLHGVNISPCLFDVEKAPETISDLNPDIVINTSCEHMFDMSNISTTNPKTLYVFQSCDKGNDPGHINPCKSSIELMQKSGLVYTAFKGKLDLGHKSRFMVIGDKRF